MVFFHTIGNSVHIYFTLQLSTLQMTLHTVHRPGISDFSSLSSSLFSMLSHEPLPVPSGMFNLNHFSPLYYVQKYTAFYFLLRSKFILLHKILIFLLIARFAIAILFQFSRSLVHSFVDMLPGICTYQLTLFLP